MDGLRKVWQNRNGAATGLWEQAIHTLLALTNEKKVIIYT
jgi:hypothetical protein